MGVLRHPRTTQERRSAAALNFELDYAELRVRVRGCRGVETLPTYYDDLFKSRRGDRSWKNLRRAQWT